MVFVIGSIVLADLCVNSPDDKILAILDRIRQKISPIIVESLIFYITGKSDHGWSTKKSFLRNRLLG